MAIYTAMKIAAVFIIMEFVAESSQKAFIKKRSINKESNYAYERAFCEFAGEDGAGKKDGKYAHPRYCEKFITCEHFSLSTNLYNAKATVQSCPTPLYFDEKLNVCNWPFYTECFKYQGRICFNSNQSSAKNFITINSTNSGSMKALKLIKTGRNGCQTYQSTYQSAMDVWITSDTHKAGFFYPALIEYSCFIYSQHYKGHEKPENLYFKWFSNQKYPYKVKKGKSIRVWFGKDVFNLQQNNEIKKNPTQTNNSNNEEHCIEAYILYTLDGFYG